MTILPFNNLMRLFTLGASAAILTACASIATRLPDITPAQLEAEKAVQQDIALTELSQKTARLMNVGWPVIEKNAALCGKIRPAIGVKTHSNRSYGKAFKTASQGVLGAQAKPSILHIIPASPADRAGLRTGDILLGPANKPVKETDADFWQQLRPNQPVSINIERGGTVQSVQISATEICRYRLRLRPSLAVNAYADGRNITVTSGMMDFTATDDELAMIIGHELAHNSMGHIRKIISNRILSGNATRFTRPFESEADYVGLYYQVRAGYSPDTVEDFWRRLSAVSPKGVARAKSHPTFPDRFLRLAAAREEIEAKQKAGLTLLPNFITQGVKNQANKNQDRKNQDNAT